MLHELGYMLCCMVMGGNLGGGKHVDVKKRIQLSELIKVMVDGRQAE